MVPSVIGSYWGGYYLWNLYDAVPRGLRGVSLKGAGGVALSDPAMAIFIGAAAAALATEIAWTSVWHPHAPGAARAIGATVGVLVTLPPLLVRLARSGRVLATALWLP